MAAGDPVPAREAAGGVGGAGERPISGRPGGQALAARCRPVDLGDVDDTGQTVTVTANLATDTEGDWYQVRALDASAAGPNDSFYFRVRFTDNPSNEFAFDVYRGGCARQDSVCTNDTDTSWAVDFGADVDPSVAGTEGRATARLTLGPRGATPAPTTRRSSVCWCTARRAFCPRVTATRWRPPMGSSTRREVS